MNKYLIFISILLVVTGSLNTLTTKWADTLSSVNSGGEDVEFVHPFLQALSMFLGEMLCLVVFKITYKVYQSRGDGSEATHKLTKGNTQFNPFILMIPAMCDMVATSTMYVGLNLTYASSFQMFRGAVIIFVGIFSVAFLGRQLLIREWVGIVLVIIGLVVVGVSDIMDTPTDKSYNTNDIITGDLLIIAAQIIIATQMVVEEKFVSGLDIPPLQAVGWEGIFGFCVLSLLLIPFNFIYVGPTFSKNPRLVLEDVWDAIIQLKNNYLIDISLFGTIISISFFNFAGISITKEISATTRMVLDSVRTVIIWICSLMFMGQSFQWLQLVGFIVLLYGMFLYNGITLVGPIVNCWLKFKNRRYGTVQDENVENHVANETGTSRGRT